MSAHRLDPRSAFAIAADMHQFGVDLMRQNLRRRHPAASTDEIDALLRDWLHTRPGARFGDGVGRPVSWPRRSS